MYGLQDLIGEKNLNNAFKAYVEAARFKPKAPFTTTLEWYDYMKEATPPEFHYYLEDSFKNIVLYSNKVTNSSYKKTTNGMYEVTIEVESNKNYCDGNGKLLSTGDKPNMLEIAVFDNDSQNKAGITIKSPLVLKKVWVKPGKSTYNILQKNYR
ncbi:MAG: hypothetical protein I4O51_10895 [Flavobacterium micromati]|nr:hypothetical protein [Flavobacterium micromati]